MSIRRAYNKYQDLIINLTVILGIGLGYATKLRFFLDKKIGISEISILVLIILVFKRYYKKLFMFTLDQKGLMKLYLFISIFFISPMLTLVRYYFGSNCNEPIYIVSFVIEWIFFFLIIELMREGLLNFRGIILIISWIYIGLNLFLIFNPFFYYNKYRFEGLAENPNQLILYGISFLLLSSIFLSKRQALIVSLFIFFIIYKTGSDAGILSIFIIFGSYLYLKIFKFKTLSYSSQIFIYILIGAFFSLFLFYFFKEKLYLLWINADEGNARISLYFNALSATLSAPFFGNGVGSFSGIARPFLGSEAHNTFLDFATQFGFIFAIILYYIILKFIFLQIKLEKYEVTAISIGFFVITLFHFFGRHFIFWFLLSIFYYNIYYTEGRHKRLGKTN